MHKIWRQIRKDLNALEWSQSWSALYFSFDFLPSDLQHSLVEEEKNYQITTTTFRPNEESYASVFFYIVLNLVFLFISGPEWVQQARPILTKISIHYVEVFLTREHLLTVQKVHQSKKKRTLLDALYPAILLRGGKKCAL